MHKLKNTTWTLGDKPCKTMKIATGCWTDTPAYASKTGKVGKQKSAIFQYAKRVN